METTPSQPRKPANPNVLYIAYVQWGVDVYFYLSSGRYCREINVPNVLFHGNSLDFHALY